MAKRASWKITRALLIAPADAILMSKITPLAERARPYPVFIAHRFSVALITETFSFTLLTASFLTGTLLAAHKTTLSSATVERIGR